MRLSRMAIAHLASLYEDRPTTSESKAKDGRKDQDLGKKLCERDIHTNPPFSSAN